MNAALYTLVCPLKNAFLLFLKLSYGCMNAAGRGSGGGSSRAMGGEEVLPGCE